MGENELLTYDEMLEKLEDNSHILLANGFNFSLGVNTSYPEIFKRMKDDSPEYDKLEDEFKKVNSDLELVIGNLQESIIDNKHSNFLTKFISNKIKADFMKATYSIVTESLKKIYSEKNDDIYILFSKFKNYFTLNYDPFLYLLLMKFKNNNPELIAFQNNTKFIEEELNTDDKELYKLIRVAHENGHLTLDYENELVKKDLKDIGKQDFINQIKTIIKEKHPNIKKGNINKVSKLYLNNLKTDGKTLIMNDGFQGKLFSNYENESYQNVFFVHGAFHIYKDGKSIQKFTQTGERTFNQKLEHIIDSENRDIVCILKATDKENDIRNNEYLSNAFNMLNDIEGELVIFGSSLSDNDNHIFNKINMNPRISKLYISTSKKRIDKIQVQANKLFPNKSISYFDYTTVTY